MRFSFAALAAFVAALLPTISAWVVSQNIPSDDGLLSSALWDNGDPFKCVWQGKYVRGSQQFMSCNNGFASWIQINPGNPPPQLIQAYAYGGLNFKWAINPVRGSHSEWRYNTCLFDCSSMQAQKALSLMRTIQWTGNETTSEMMATMKAAIGGKEAVAFTA